MRRTTSDPDSPSISDNSFRALRSSFETRTTRFSSRGLLIDAKLVAEALRVNLDLWPCFQIEPPDAFAEAFRAVSTTPPKEPKTAKVPIVRPLPFETLRGVEIWRPRPPIRYIVDGFLPVGSLGMLCALGSSHKSWLLADMALAVARGRPWLWEFPTGAPKRVLYMDYENNEDETARRIIGLEQQPIEGLQLAVMPDLFLTNHKFLPEIENIARQFDFVAIDSLSGGSEDMDENSAKFAQCLKRMKRAGAKTGCGFVVLHHSRKPLRGRDGEEIEDANKKSKPRGTNAIYNALDSLLDIDNVDDTQSRLTHTKQRGPRKLAPFTICIEGVAPAPTRIFVPNEQEIAKAKEDKRIKEVFAKFKRTLKGDAMSGSALIAAAGGRKQDRLGDLHELVKLGWLSFDGKLYSILPTGSQTGSRGGSKKEGVGNRSVVRLVPAVPEGPEPA
jgi:hypothetical protein